MIFLKKNREYGYIDIDRVWKLCKQSDSSMQSDSRGAPLQPAQCNFNSSIDFCLIFPNQDSKETMSIMYMYIYIYIPLHIYQVTSGQPFCKGPSS